MQTALLIKEVKVVVMTMPDRSGTFVEISFTDDKWAPVGKREMSIDPRQEADYHKALRKDAFIAGQLVTQYCTNPELNPTNEA